MRYGGEVQVGGRVAAVGQRLLESTARSLTRQGLAALDASLVAPAASGTGNGQLGRSTAVAAQAPEVASALSPTPQPSISQSPNLHSPISNSPSVVDIATEVARDVAKDLAADYIPADKQERVVWFTLGALAMLAFVVLVRLVQRK